MAAWIGPAISAGASLLGGLMQKKPKVDYTQAKNQIRWRVADAKAAGIHPLYALGSPTVGPTVTTDPSLGGAIADAGQAIGSAYTQSQARKSQAALAQAQLLETQSRAEAARAQAALDKTRALEITQRMKQASDGQRIALKVRGAGRAPTPTDGLLPEHIAVQKEGTKNNEVLQVPGFGRVEVPPKLTTPETVKKYLGESEMAETLLSFLYGGGMLGWNLARNRRPQRYKRNRRGRLSTYKLPHQR